MKLTLIAIALVFFACSTDSSEDNSNPAGIAKIDRTGSATELTEMVFPYWQGIDGPVAPSLHWSYDGEWVLISGSRADTKTSAGYSTYNYVLNMSSGKKFGACDYVDQGIEIKGFAHFKVEDRFMIAHRGDGIIRCTLSEDPTINGTQEFIPYSDGAPKRLTNKEIFWNSEGELQVGLEGVLTWTGDWLPLEVSQEVSVWGLAHEGSAGDYLIAWRDSAYTSEPKFYVDQVDEKGKRTTLFTTPETNVSEVLALSDKELVYSTYQGCMIGTFATGTSRQIGSSCPDTLQKGSHGLFLDKPVDVAGQTSTGFRTLSNGYVFHWSYSRDINHMDELLLFLDPIEGEISHSFEKGFLLQTVTFDLDKWRLPLFYLDVHELGNNLCLLQGQAIADAKSGKDKNSTDLKSMYFSCDDLSNHKLFAATEEVGYVDADFKNNAIIAEENWFVWSTGPKGSEGAIVLTTDNRILVVSVPWQEKEVLQSCTGNEGNAVPALQCSIL